MKYLSFLPFLFICESFSLILTFTINDFSSFFGPCGGKNYNLILNVIVIFPVVRTSVFNIISSFLFNFLFILYIYISGVKISLLKKEIIFFRLNIFNAINFGAGLGLATLFTTAASVSFFLENDCVYLDAERLHDHIKRETFQIDASNTAQRCRCAL